MTSTPQGVPGQAHLLRWVAGCSSSPTTAPTGRSYGLTGDRFGHASSSLALAWGPAPADWSDRHFNRVEAQLLIGVIVDRPV
jgi:hypothetical protein